jgi:hypothetical protein
MRVHVVLIALVATLALPIASAQADGSAHITKAQFGKMWPLTVASGTVHCSAEAVTFQTPGANGRVYAVNGTAQGRYPKMARISKIERKNPAAGTLIDLSPIVFRGLKLCGI